MGGIIVCPNCGAKNNKISNLDDKTQVITCGNCNWLLHRKDR